MSQNNLPFNSVYTRKSIPLNTLGLYDTVDIDYSWREKALCKDKPISDFFPTSRKTDTGKIVQSLNLCYQCSVSHYCVYEAMKYNYDGIWGGSLYPQRLYFIRTELNNDLSNLTLKIAKSFSRNVTPHKYKLHIRRRKNIDLEKDVV